VQLDADWNEWNEILDRRWRSETIDIIGRCVVPLETPDGFEIQLSGGKMTIGRGRIYVHGLQAENHGTGDLQFDFILAESRGSKRLYCQTEPVGATTNVYRWCSCDTKWQVSTLL
jgi:hypothetical protein